jgi:tetratricopeptide (TPR) repeat protein
MDLHYCQLPITTAAPAAARAIHGFAAELLSHGANARVIFDAVAADENCALGHAYAAALHLTQLTREGQMLAAPHIVAARANLADCDQREIDTVKAIAAWSEGADKAAIVILREVVEYTPNDLVAAKLCQILELGVGDVLGMLRTSAMAAAIEGRSGYAMGLHAFALEQAGHAELAHRVARRAVELNPDRDPWAQHAVAHSLIALNQPIEARAFLQGAASSWARCSSFMQTHNWWHLALLELQLDSPANALALFDEHVWGVRKGHVQDQINAISLLARLEIHGVRSVARWSDIAAHLEHRVDDHVSAFVDLHYLIALIRSGRAAEAAAMVERLRFERVPGALAQAILLHSIKDYRGAAMALAPVRQHLDQIGGSNIQRELFSGILADSIDKCPGLGIAQGADHYRVAA